MSLFCTDKHLLNNLKKERTDVFFTASKVSKQYGLTAMGVRKVTERSDIAPHLSFCSVFCHMFRSKLLFRFKNDLLVVRNETKTLTLTSVVCLSFTKQKGHLQ